jgi:hypothetical protein
LLAAAATLAPGAVAQDDAALRAKVTRYTTTWLRDGGMPAGKRDTAVRFLDLNGDGRPEALVIINSPDTCGARGCTAFALDLRGAEARSIGDFTAQTLDALPTMTNGWRDLSLNGHRVTFHGGRYNPVSGR